MTLALPLCQPPQPSLGSLSYHYIIGTRDWEIVGKSGSVSFRLHMVPYDSDRWNGFLSFRNYLRSHRNVALEYCHRKRGLAYMHRLDPRG